MDEKSHGKLAKRLCQAMAAEPDDRYKDGSPFWLSIIAEAWKNKDGEYEFQMWPELAEAHETLNPDPQKSRSLSGKKVVYPGRFIPTGGHPEGETES